MNEGLCQNFYELLYKRIVSHNVNHNVRITFQKVKESKGDEIWLKGAGSEVKLIKEQVKALINEQICIFFVNENLKVIF